jgi:hypothetical protein
MDQEEEFVTGRVSVAPTDWSLEFLLKLAGAYRWEVAVSAMRRKVVSNAVVLKLLKIWDGAG